MSQVHIVYGVLVNQEEFLENAKSYTIADLNTFEYSYGLVYRSELNNKELLVYKIPGIGKNFLIGVKAMEVGTDLSGYLSSQRSYDKNVLHDAEGDYDVLLRELYDIRNLDYPFNENLLELLRGQDGKIYCVNLF